MQVCYLKKTLSRLLASSGVTLGPTALVGHGVIMTLWDRSLIRKQLSRSVSKETT